MFLRRLSRVRPRMIVGILSAFGGHHHFSVRHWRKVNPFYVGVNITKRKTVQIVLEIGRTGVNIGHFLPGKDADKVLFLGLRNGLQSLFEWYPT